MNTTARIGTLDSSTSTAAVTPAALGAAGVSLAVACLQAALAAGAPLGEHVWGGTHDRVLPTGMRMASAGAAVTLPMVAAVIARRAGLIGQPARWLTPATWGIAGFLALNTVGNLASSSPVERLAFAPATAAASALTAIVASRTRHQ